MRIDWRDIALHCLGAALIMGVCIAGALATDHRLWFVGAGVAFNVVFWPAREIDQHGLRWPWRYTGNQWAEMGAPVGLALLAGALSTIVL